MPSVSWRSTRTTGLRERPGSWNTMATSLPQTVRLSFLVSVSRSRPLNTTCPETPVSRVAMPMIERAMTDLPDPDSPTTPSDSPAADVERDPVDGPDDSTG